MGNAIPPDLLLFVQTPSTVAGHFSTGSPCTVRDPASARACTHPCPASATVGPPLTPERKRRHMSSCLVVQHLEPESSYAIGEALSSSGIDVDQRRTHTGAPLPRTLDGFDGLVVMGGPMSADSDDGFPTRRQELDLLSEAVELGLPTLGVCLGAQLLAAATGGRVLRGASGPEIGWGPVRLEATAADGHVLWPRHRANCRCSTGTAIPSTSPPVGSSWPRTTGTTTRRSASAQGVGLPVPPGGRRAGGSGLRLRLRSRSGRAGHHPRRSPGRDAHRVGRLEVHRRPVLDRFAALVRGRSPRPRRRPTWPAACPDRGRPDPPERSFSTA